MISGYNIELDSIAWGRMKNNNWKCCMFFLSYMFFFSKKKFVIETNEPRVLEKLPILAHKKSEVKKMDHSTTVLSLIFQYNRKSFVNENIFTRVNFIDKDRWLIECVQNKKILLWDYRGRKISAKINFPFF